MVSDRGTREANFKGEAISAKHGRSYIACPPALSGITLLWDPSNKKKRTRQPFNPVTRRKVAKNKGNICNKHRASKTIMSFN